MKDKNNRLAKVPKLLQDLAVDNVQVKAEKVYSMSWTAYN